MSKDSERINRSLGQQKRRAKEFFKGKKWDKKTLAKLEKQGRKPLKMNKIKYRYIQTQTGEKILEEEEK